MSEMHENENGSSKRSLFERSEDTNILVTKLSEATDKGPGHIVSYDTLSAALGRRVSGSTSNLQSARKVLLAERNVVFTCIPSVGLKVADSANIVQGAKGQTRRVSRLAKRTLRCLACCEFDKLTPDQQNEHNTTAAVMGLMQHVTKQTTVKQLSGKVEAANKRLPVNETLKALVKK